MRSGEAQFSPLIIACRSTDAPGSITINRHPRNIERAAADSLIGLPLSADSESERIAVDEPGVETAYRIALDERRQINEIYNGRNLI